MYSRSHSNLQLKPEKSCRAQQYQGNRISENRWGHCPLRMSLCPTQPFPVLGSQKRDPSYLASHIPISSLLCLYLSQGFPPSSEGWVEQVLGPQIFPTKLWKLGPPGSALGDRILQVQPVTQEGQTEDAGTTGEKERGATRILVSSALGYFQH